MTPERLAQDIEDRLRAELIKFFGQYVEQQWPRMFEELLPAMARAVTEAWKGETKALRAKVDDAMNILGQWENIDKAEAIARADVAETRIRVLTEALEQYGRHRSARCGVGDCNCGLAEAISPAPVEGSPQ